MGWLPRGKRIRGAVLLLTVLIVVAASTVGPAVIPEPDEEEREEYDIQADLAERAPSDGRVAVDEADEPGVVLVDLAHRNRLEPKEFQPLLAGLTDAGYEIDFLESTDDFDQSLSRADAFVVIDPDLDYTDAEVDRVDTFVDRGGRLLLVGEPTSLTAGALTVQFQDNKLTTLSSRFGFEFGEAYLFNMERNDGNHQNIFAEPTGDRRLTSGVSRAAFYAATQIHIREGEPILTASDATRSSRTDDTGTYPVAAVNGNVLAIADGTFLRRGNFNVVDNEAFVRNVVRFLVSSDKRRGLDAYPTFLSADPTIRFTDAGLTDAAQLLSADLRDRGGAPTLRIQRDTVSPDRTDVLVTTYDYLARNPDLETGIGVSSGRVQVAGYNSPATGVIVVRAPSDGFDLVIAADTPARVQEAVDLLVDGSLRDRLIDPRTAVVRTSAVQTPTESE